MEWEFTPQQVVKGEVAYGLEDFRRDLRHEVAMNLPEAGTVAPGDAAALVYDLCYWRATGKPAADFLAGFAYDPPTVEILEFVDAHLGPNVEMLGAILQRMIMDRVESGMPLEQALGEVARRNAGALAGRT